MQTKANIAEAVNLHEPIIRDIAVRLGQMGLVEGQRGHGGGYRLKVPIESISIYDVGEAMELYNLKRPMDDEFVSFFKSIMVVDMINKRWK